MSSSSTITTRSLRKSSRVRRLSSKALNSDNRDQFINTLNPNSDPSIPRQQEQEPSFKKRRLSINSFEPVNNFNFINVKIANTEEEEDFLLNLSNNNIHSNGNNNNSINNNLEEELRETELRISELFNTTIANSPPPTPTIVESPITPTVAANTTSLEEFLNYDLMPSLTDESDLESAPEYLPQCFDYRSNHDSVNLSLIQNGVNTQKKFINAIKKRSADVFLTDGMFSQFF